MDNDHDRFVIQGRLAKVGSLLKVDWSTRFFIEGRLAKVGSLLKVDWPGQVSNKKGVSYRRKKHGRLRVMEWSRPVIVIEED